MESAEKKVELMINTFSHFYLKLCELLKIKEKVPYTIPTPVEAALEANEAALTTNRKNAIKRTESTDRSLHAKNGQIAADDESPPKLVRVPIGSLPPIQISPTRQKTSSASDNQPKTHPFEVHCDDYEYVDKADPNSKSNSIARVRYEIPESKLSRTATLILGNRRELEMHEFSSSKLNFDRHIAGDGSNTSRRHSQALPEIDPSGDRQQPIE